MLLLRRFSSLAASCHVSPSSSPAKWVPAAVSQINPATPDSSLFHVTLDLSSHPPVSASHVSPGQFISLRVSPDSYPLLLAIASPPLAGTSLDAQLELLVKRIPGTVSDVICGMREGDFVEVGEVMGRGFEIGRLWSNHVGGDDVDSILMFATGSGISPIRSLIESNFNENKRADATLYYGARNLQRMAYQDRFNYWESKGVRVIPVLSRPDNRWTGEQGYVQNIFLRDKRIVNPCSTGAVLCGHRQMTEEITSILLADGVSHDKILKNF